MKEVSVLPQAKEQLDEIALWYDSQVPGLGESFVDSFEDSVEHISQFPKAFEVKRHNMRQGSIRRFPYLIIYEEQEDEVVIYSVIHAKQKPSKRYKKGKGE